MDPERTKTPARAIKKATKAVRGKKAATPKITSTTEASETQTENANVTGADSEALQTPAPKKGVGRGRKTPAPNKTAATTDSQAESISTGSDAPAAPTPATKRRGRAKKAPDFKAPVASLTTAVEREDAGTPDANPAPNSTDSGQAGDASSAAAPPEKTDKRCNTCHKVLLLSQFEKQYKNKVSSLANCAPCREKKATWSRAGRSAKENIADTDVAQFGETAAGDVDVAAPATPAPKKVNTGKTPKRATARKNAAPDTPLPQREGSVEAVPAATPAPKGRGKPKTTKQPATPKPAAAVPSASRSKSEDITSANTRASAAPEEVPKEHTPAKTRRTSGGKGPAVLSTIKEQAEATVDDVAASTTLEGSPEERAVRPTVGGKGLSYVSTSVLEQEETGVSANDTPAPPETLRRTWGEKGPVPPQITAQYESDADDEHNAHSEDDADDESDDEDAAANPPATPTTATRVQPPRSSKRPMRSTPAGTPEPTPPAPAQKGPATKRPLATIPEDENEEPAAKRQRANGEVVGSNAATGDYVDGSNLVSHLMLHSLSGEQVLTFSQTALLQKGPDAKRKPIAPRKRPANMAAHFNAPAGDQHTGASAGTGQPAATPVAQIDSDATVTAAGEDSDNKRVRSDNAVLSDEKPTGKRAKLVHPQPQHSQATQSISTSREAATNNTTAEETSEVPVPGMQPTGQQQTGARPVTTGQLGGKSIPKNTAMFTISNSDVEDQFVVDPEKAVVAHKSTVFLRHYHNDGKTEECYNVPFPLRKLVRRSLRVARQFGLNGQASVEQNPITLPRLICDKTVMDYSRYILARSNYLWHDDDWTPDSLLQLYLLAMWMEDPDCCDVALSTLIRLLRSKSAEEILFSLDVGYIVDRVYDFQQLPDGIEHSNVKKLARYPPVFNFFVDLLAAPEHAAQMLEQLKAEANMEGEFAKDAAAKCKKRADGDKTEPLYLGKERLWCAKYHFCDRLCNVCHVERGLDKMEQTGMPETRKIPAYGEPFADSDDEGDDVEVQEMETSGGNDGIEENDGAEENADFQEDEYSEGDAGSEENDGDDESEDVESDEEGTDYTSQLTERPGIYWQTNFSDTDSGGDTDDSSDADTEEL